nr:SH3 and PX domain-containing protein 2B-like isoform X2 [Hydra vulgaris]
MIKNYIIKVSIPDVAKKRKPTKHYVYIINLLWSDGTQQIICRRYCQFFDLQTNLIDAFPLESGEVNPNQRILPLLPGKILFGRSSVKNVALKRKDLLSEYLQKLIALPEKISQCSFVMEFFEVTHEDIQNLTSEDMAIKNEQTAHNTFDPSPLEQYIAIESFEKTERNQVALKMGDVVDVIEKCDNGWWFVSIENEQGWAPGSFLEPLGCDKRDIIEESIYGMEEKFFCIKTYKAEQPDELSLTLGDIVFVLVKYSDGWWNVRLKRDADEDYDGLVPAVNLSRIPQGAEAGVIRQSKTNIQSRGIVAPPRRNSYKMKTNFSTDKILFDEKGKLNSLPNVNQIEISESLYVASTHIKEFGEKKIDIFEGAPVVVLEKLPSGWWYIDVGGVGGWVLSKMITRASVKKWALSSYISNVHSSYNDIKDTSKDLDFVTSCTQNLSKLPKKFQPPEGDFKPPKKFHCMLPPHVSRPNLNTKSFPKTSTGIASQCFNQQNNNKGTPFLREKPAVPKKPLTKLSETESKTSLNSPTCTESKISTAFASLIVPNFKESKMQAISTIKPTMPVEEGYIDIEKYQHKYEEAIQKISPMKPAKKGYIDLENYQHKYEENIIPTKRNLQSD